MPSRQDQLHSYQFAVQRVVAALVMRETDPAQSPFRRAAGATLASVLVAVIALGGVALYGLFVEGGSSKWKDESAVVVEKESGARYVYREGRLHPVLNYASALLIIGSPGTEPVFVSAKSIEGVPRGAPLGIPDAPDSLTPPGRLSGHPWTVCSRGAGGAGPRSTVLVGQEPQGGTALGDDQGVLVQEGDRLHLIWHNRRHLIREAAVVLPVLNATSRPKVQVAPAFLNSVPASTELAPLKIPGLGEPFAPLQGAKVGEVFVIKSQGGAEQYAVAMREGLAAISQLQANLVLSDPAISQIVRQGDDATPLGQAERTRIRQLPNPVPGGATLPPKVPDLAEVDAGVVCAIFRGDAGAAEMRVNAGTPDAAEGVRTGARSPDGTILADQVVVEPGRGAVVQAAPAPGEPGALSIVTSLGRRYAVPGENVLGMLGYSEVKPVRLPANVVALLPAGRALDPEAARVPAAQ